jgi:hypothetical protein
MRLAAALGRGLAMAYLLALPFVYSIAAVVVAVSPPAGARRAAARGNPRAQRDYGSYLTTLAMSLTVVPALICAVVVAFTFAGLGPFAILFWLFLSGPGMFALLLRLVIELSSDANLAVWQHSVVDRCRWLPGSA